MRVIILAGGKATRLPHSSRELPKALVAVHGKPVLQHQIDLLEHHGFNDIRFGLGAKAQHIIDYLGGRHEYVVEPRPLGTGGAVKFTSQGFKEPFFVLNGDVLSDIHFADFADAYRHIGASHMIAAWHAPDVRDFGSLHVPELEDKKKQVGRVHGFFEKPNEKHAGFINAGVYILHPELLASYGGEVFSIEQDIFPRLVKEGALHAYLHGGWWMEMGTEERLKQAREEFEKH